MLSTILLGATATVLLLIALVAIRDNRRLSKNLARAYKNYDDTCDELDELAVSHRRLRRELDMARANNHNDRNESLIKRLVFANHELSSTVLNMTKTHDLLLKEIEDLQTKHAQAVLGGKVVSLVSNDPKLYTDKQRDAYLVDPHIFTD